ncbi:integrase [Bifidobacterium longum]|uniref:integrase n=1 Tax=Bifidobacterium longum TaxID=216816 RepID=UPI001927425F|nr:integrase [Bifidobacterium longum]MBL3909495.1 integrase [Bifidobacterium longum subsp. longum]
MAKYTREQRQRAVELYVKYEGCAADVIRELGYPSREALRMWCVLASWRPLCERCFSAV